MMQRLKLTINEAKTRVCRCRKNGSISWATVSGDGTRQKRAVLISVRGRRRRASSGSSERSARAPTKNDVAGGRRVGVADQWQADWLGQLLFVGSGQQGISCDRAVHPARLRRWLCDKHKVANSGLTRYPDEYLHGTLGLVGLCTRRETFRGRKPDALSESRMREIRMSGSMSGMWKRSHGSSIATPPDERGGNS